jgi:erythromycin esterase
LRKMPVPLARPESWEHVLHQAGATDKLLIFDPDRDAVEFLEPRGHRAIGVVYRPKTEAFGNYVPTTLSRRYDALAYIDVTEALHPLHVPASFEAELPETYPSGV